MSSVIAYRGAGNTIIDINDIINCILYFKFLWWCLDTVSVIFSYITYQHDINLLLIITYYNNKLIFLSGIIIVKPILVLLLAKFKINIMYKKGDLNTWLVHQSKINYTFFNCHIIKYNFTSISLKKFLKSQ